MTITKEYEVYSTRPDGIELVHSPLKGYGAACQHASELVKAGHEAVAVVVHFKRAPEVKAGSPA